MQQHARLIIEDQLALPGAFNMATDETLLRSAAEDSVTSLRFYGWSPATLSLGYFQNLSDRELHSASQSCECVRRASGGGAIIHDHELTYCFAVPTESRFGDSLTHYLAFHETLVELLSEQGISAVLHNGSTESAEEPFLCFQRRASNDVLLDGHKIAGSAQRRWKNALVQHGSVLLEQSKYAPELPGLKELASFDLSPRLLAKAWVEKLSSRLNLEFLEGSLTDKESRLLGQLQKDKFSTRRWIARR